MGLRPAVRVAKAFVRAAFEYQYWKDSCTGLALAHSDATVGGFTANSDALSQDAHVDLVGFGIAAGLTW